MSASSNIAAGYSTEIGEIRTVSGQKHAPPKTPQDVQSANIAGSLPSESVASGAIALLTSYLGPMLTVANPAWMGDPVPCMRALQKKLVEHSLALQEWDRSDCMAAISVVETAVQLRLRLQQMRMTEAEREFKTESEAAQ